MKRFEFSLLSWLQAISMFTALLGLIFAGWFFSNQDNFISEEGALHLPDD